MSNIKDLKHDIQVAYGINATLAGATPAKGNIIDRQGFGSVTFLFATGAITDAGTASGFSVEIQHSDTTADTAFTAVEDKYLIGSESDLTVTSDTADSVPIGSIGYIGSKRYVRAVFTGTTGTDGAVFGLVVKGHPHFAPVSPAVAANIAAT